MALSPIQRVAVRHLAAGWSDERVSQELKVAKGQITKWRKLDPEFKKALEEATLDHVTLVEAMLVDGERQAAETLIQALRAESRGGPNWTVRLNAALSLLDRAGQRGRAVEKQQIAQVVARAQPEVEDALRRALRDPGVRSWLKGQEKGLADPLPSGEVVSLEVDLDPENPDSVPLLLTDSTENVA